MKTLIVNFRDSYSVELKDYDDNRSQEEYAESISKILDNNNITILHATSGSLIVRPNEVASILVVEAEDEYSDETSETIFEIEPDDPPQEIKEDIITD